MLILGDDCPSESDDAVAALDRVRQQPDFEERRLLDFEERRPLAFEGLKVSFSSPASTAAPGLCGLQYTLTVVVHWGRVEFTDP
mmetsp:Transcript_68877/g.206568  ORF Transcript_68877/g.206568 Transcript_68877/m.206568 type:complete len:84 (-) Transcript_68877:73-324(-)